jgi:hypothetical protein
MQIETVIGPFLIVFSSGMLVTAAMSYHRTHSLKMVFVNLVFVLFLFKGILMVLSLFIKNLGPLYSLASFGIIDIVMIVFLFLATLKRIPHE